VGAGATPGENYKLILCFGITKYSLVHVLSSIVVSVAHSINQKSPHFGA
jgi:hypothetical protein